MKIVVVDLFDVITHRTGLLAVKLSSGARYALRYGYPARKVENYTASNPYNFSCDENLSDAGCSTDLHPSLC